MNIFDDIKNLLKRKDPSKLFLARQLMFNQLPASYFVENYLYNNEGRPQNLKLFPMMRYIYDNMPQNLLLKCSRKTLKSTLVSNMMALNMIRYNYYTMMYVGNLEATAKNFSANYFMPRFESPRVKEILNVGFVKEDVFEKVLGDTRSSVLFKYVSEDASRTRGPSVHSVLYDEVQGIAYDQIPIIQETMALLPHKRQIFAGTPLSSANTIHQLWQDTDQREWCTKCQSCSHWNMLHESNSPEKMLLEHGYSCSKCSSLIDTTEGEWVAFNPSITDFTGYHLAQPMLPFFNRNKEEWSYIYKKVADKPQGVVYNEVLGLSYDSASLIPITMDELRAACVLGPMFSADKKLRIYENNRNNYWKFVLGADWGVSQETSCSVVCYGGIRRDGVLEIYHMKKYKDFNHESHVRDIAKEANDYGAVGLVDGGPDPIRGIKLIELTAPNRVSMVRYEHGKLISRYDWIPGSDWRTGRQILHRSDSLGLMFRMIKEKRILFPAWVDVSDFLQDLLNVYIEIQEGKIRQEMFYRRKPGQTDDFAHALNFINVSAMSAMGDVNLTGASSSSGND